MKRLSLFLISSFAVLSAQAQKWQPGFFIDIRNQKVEGLIKVNPSGKGPIKDEGFIAFKENEKANEMRLSASDIRNFKAGKDSFVVAHAPKSESWSLAELDFVKVVLNEDPTKLYVINGSVSGGGSGFSVRPGVSIGAGSGGYGGLGGGVGISLGGGGGGGGRNNGKITYYYGPTPGDLHRLTDQNFVDVMCDIMGDEPDLVVELKSNKYGIRNMDALVDYFNHLKASHKTNN